MSFLLAKDEEKIIEDDKEELVRLGRIEKRIDKLETILKRLESSLPDERQ